LIKRGETKEQKRDRRGGGLFRSSKVIIATEKMRRRIGEEGGKNKIETAMMWREIEGLRKTGEYRVDGAKGVHVWHRTGEGGWTS